MERTYSVELDIVIEDDDYTDNTMTIEQDVIDALEAARHGAFQSVTVSRIVKE